MNVRTTLSVTGLTIADSVEAAPVPDVPAPPTRSSRLIPIVLFGSIITAQAAWFYALAWLIAVIFGEM